ncbi:hypothetical protein BGZ51_004238 [Haplosporangium sp. Z 767]|nr:hypothetical protein BGZ50_008260 [Haplosporangium sp. Z 11]KAF9183092.1 hypothetical protein BGZ51_004238 [Haplosporangium sp. Z 767]
MTFTYCNRRPAGPFILLVPAAIITIASLLQYHSEILVDARSLERRLPQQHADIDTSFESTLSTISAISVSGSSNRTDYCTQAAEASRINRGVIPYAAAKGCYEMFAFNPQTRDDTIQSVRANLESFYVFYDIAESPPYMENSDLGPVDLSASLEALGNTTYVNDYSFHSDLAHMLAKLQDPHTTYKSMCYNQFLFVQPLSTYGVFEDGRQQVKVATVLNNLDPQLDTNLIDCEVTDIDGRPAFEVVTEFARTKSYSKDRGVRLNKAFSYLAHDKIRSFYDRYALGTFAQRSSIPPKATIEYQIDCRSKFSSRASAVHDINTPPHTTIELAWSALDATMAPYEDSQSYRQQFCSDDSIRTVKKFVLDSAFPDDFDAGRTYLRNGRKKSREIYRGPYASFHMLGDDITAVFRLGTESPSKIPGQHNVFYSNIDNGFAALEAAGATKLIMDLQSNSGGIICWGRYVLQTLFPFTVDSPYIYNLRSSRLAQILTAATFRYEQKVASPYEGLGDPKTGEEVVDESWMIPGTKLPGREGYFSHQVTDRYCPAVDDIKEYSGNVMFEPENIIMLTNGFCGSTCAVLALQLQERYGVRSVAIGGHHGESMAFTSFPGGAVQANNTLWVNRIQQIFDTLPKYVRTKDLNALLPKQLPANGQLAFTFRQVMSALYPDQVAEYRRAPSDFRMDYTTARFRMPTVLWEDVREAVFGQPKSVEDAIEDEETVEEDEEAEWRAAGDEQPQQRMRIGGEMIVVAEEEEMEGITQEADREDLKWLQQYEMF